VYEESEEEKSCASEMGRVAVMGEASSPTHSIMSICLFVLLLFFGEEDTGGGSRAVYPCLTSRSRSSEFCRVVQFSVL
jgi:hypothetical protein